MATELLELKVRLTSCSATLKQRQQRFLNTSCFEHQAFRQTFITLYSTLPLSAAVERVFSTGKNIVKPERAGLSDNHFKMPQFLKSSNQETLFAYM